MVMKEEDKNIISYSLVHAIDRDAERKRRKSENVTSWLHVQGWLTISGDREKMSLQVTLLRKYQSDTSK